MRGFDQLGDIGSLSSLTLNMSFDTKQP